MKTICNIKIKSFNSRTLDNFFNSLTKDIKEQKVSMSFTRLPTRISKITLIKSPHVYKKSREQFESRHYTRVIKLRGPKDQIQSLLTRLFSKQYTSIYNKVEWCFMK
uniref:Ribosomal protein S10 n=1 Tax=Telonemida sp. TaxID=2652706 RepID=A0A5P8DJV3_9EUKA|nr:ribosomal protein S10 [Telonemida sp.]